MPILFLFLCCSVKTSLLCSFHSFVAKMTVMTRSIREEHTSKDSRMWLKHRNATWRFWVQLRRFGIANPTAKNPSSHLFPASSVMDLGGGCAAGWVVVWADATDSAAEDKDVAVDKGDDQLEFHCIRKSTVISILVPQNHRFLIQLNREGPPTPSVTVSCCFQADVENISVVSHVVKCCLCGSALSNFWNLTFNVASVWWNIDERFKVWKVATVWEGTTPWNKDGNENTWTHWCSYFSALKRWSWKQRYTFLFMWSIFDKLSPLRCKETVSSEFLVAFFFRCLCCFRFFRGHKSRKTKNFGHLDPFLKASPGVTLATD